MTSPTGSSPTFARPFRRKGRAVVFSSIEWPDKATRDAAMARMDELMKTDDRLNPEKDPIPFDGKRLIYGGFAPVVEL